MSNPKKKKKNKDVLEVMLMALLQKSLKTSLDAALKEIFKDFK